MAATLTTYIKIKINNNKGSRDTSNKTNHRHTLIIIFKNLIVPTYLSNHF